MGDEADGDGRPAHVGVPLSPNDRATIRSKLGPLNTNVVGSDVDRLIDLVDLSLSVSFEELIADPSNIPPSDDDAAYDHIGSAAIDVAQAVVDLFGAATKVDKLLRTENEDPTLSAAYTAIDLTPLEAGVDRLLKNGALDKKKTPSALVENALTALLEARQYCTSYTDSIFVKNPEFWLVRAVLYYRHEQGLSLTNNWSDPQRTENQFKRRDDKDLLPATPAAELVRHVADSFCLSVANRTLRSVMNEYQLAYRANGGTPRLRDFDHPFRHVR